MHNHHEHDHHEHDDTGMADLLDLDAEVLHDYFSDLVAWVHEAAAAPERPRILDLGSGSGTGSLALARSFPQAEVTAVDLSAEMLHHLRHRAAELALADRIHTVQADLDAGWPTLEPVDLAWASASMHHLADPDRVLADLFATVRPGGLLTVVELGSFPRFLPDDLAGFEDRAQALADAARHAHMPHIGSDWGPMLSKAGFTVEAEREFTIDLTAPLPPATGRYARATMNRLRTGLGDQLDAADRATLDALLTDDGPQSVLHRQDLHIRTARTVWLARRP
jgi:SAM-dependent methyltransferase